MASSSDSQALTPAIATADDEPLIPTALEATQVEDVASAADSGPSTGVSDQYPLYTNDLLISIQFHLTRPS